MPGNNVAINELRRSLIVDLLLIILTPWRKRATALFDDAIRTDGFFSCEEHPLLDLRSVTSKSFLGWTTINFTFQSKTIVVTGLPKVRAENFLQSVVQTQSECWSRAAAPLANEINSVSSYVDFFSDPPRYLTAKWTDQLLRRAQQLVANLPRLPIATHRPPQTKMLEQIICFLETHESDRQRANRNFVERELHDCKEYFDTVEKLPLTLEQRQAIVVDEDCNLVVAAAGSGKTSVVVSKVGWLHSRAFQRYQDILVLAFSRKAREDLRDRITERLGEAAGRETKISTFHGLGLMIIGNVERVTPSLSIMSEDDQKFTRFIKDTVYALLSDVSLSNLVVTWFQSFFSPFESATNFSSKSEYYEYLRSHEMRTLNGELVKSFEECEIANFLFTHGVNYEYERKYEAPTADAQRRQYRPDFYLTDYGIYLEHFAIGSNGRPPDFIDADEYLRQMKWKRDLHRQHGTTLIETFSYEKIMGGDAPFDTVLTTRLAEHGIPLCQIEPKLVFARLEEQGRINPFVRMLATFLNHFKGSRMSLSDLENKIRQRGESKRDLAFLSIFREVFARYQAELSKSGEIDFHDMIIRATDYIRGGAYFSPFRYIIVDEFQDISTARAELLKALLEARHDTQLLCVGDDWQSIYRFAGSDISIMRNFADNFGITERSDLTTTFRCPDRLATLSSNFILKNPAQLKKSVQSIQAVAEPCVFIGESDRDNRDLLKEAIDLIAVDVAGRGGEATVKILARYNHLKPKNMHLHSSRHRELKISFHTVHTSKGLEADYVVVVGFNAGRYGFPSEISDDPIINLVLADAEQHVSAEERRLFYVALTRAKRQVFVLNDSGAPSSFLDEISTDPTLARHFGGRSSTPAKCPDCGSGRLRLRRGQNGEFCACSNWPVCEFTQPACPQCREGIVAPSKSSFSCDSCEEPFERCMRPGCTGWLRPIDGRNGRFFGCSNWPSCGFTKN